MATDARHTAVVAELYRERYGPLEALELERYARPPVPLQPITPDQARRNFLALAEALEGRPTCLLCWRAERRRGRGRVRPYTRTGESMSSTRGASRE